MAKPKTTPAPRAARPHAVSRGSAARAETPTSSDEAHGPGPSPEQAKIIARLRTVEGHLRGITQMVEADAYCIDVLRQTKAVQAAIARIEAALLERHLEHCVSRAIRSENDAERARVIDEIVEVFGAARRG